MLFSQQVFIISYCLLFVNTFLKSFFEPTGSFIFFSFSCRLSRDSFDIISRCFPFVNTFLKSFFRPPGPISRFLLSALSLAKQLSYNITPIYFCQHFFPVFFEKYENSCFTRCVYLLYIFFTFLTIPIITQFFFPLLVFFTSAFFFFR